eukprot:scaffold1411_cov396-Prasinococcus_capsulatus_cf.AAC.6
MQTSRFKSVGDRAADTVATSKKFAQALAAWVVGRLCSDQAGEENEKVEAPEHLEEADKGKVLAHVVVAEISKSRHPYVGGNEQADGIVELGRVEVVI